MLIYLKLNHIAIFSHTVTNYLTRRKILQINTKLNFLIASIKFKLPHFLNAKSIILHLKSVLQLLYSHRIVFKALGRLYHAKLQLNVQTQ